MQPVLTPTSRPLTDEERRLYDLIGACCDRLNALEDGDASAQRQTLRTLAERIFAYLGFWSKRAEGSAHD